MEHTEYHQLNLWDPEDRILREDFNSDNAKIDAAMAGFGNCRIYTTSYVGTGAFGSASPCTLTFPGKPLLGFITNAVGKQLMFLSYQAGNPLVITADPYDVHATWAETEDGCTVQWSDGSVHSSALRQMNSQGETYHVYVLLAADAE